MIDVRLVRAEPDQVKAALARKGVDPADVDEVARLDREFREAAQRQEAARARVKELSRLVAEAKRSGEHARAEGLSNESRSLSTEQKELARIGDTAQADLRAALLVLPNLPAPHAADGKSEADNPVVQTGGPAPESFDEHQRVPHWEIGQQL
ncbi:MAG: serine--tRNA ligase, partial [Actinobacteria bacterium]|nr:serine--tRNA ligase [Actinomycetota bacterium]